MVTNAGNFYLSLPEMSNRNTLTPFRISTFQDHILKWYSCNNRDYLPWRVTKTRKVSAYHILVSEVMLQQTQVNRVREKFLAFLKAFSTLHVLSRAPLRDILVVWQGMGYNRRAIYLKRAAEILVAKYNGTIPRDPKLLDALPGIGPYTAGAIACFAYNKPTVFLDTNIRKVFIHHFFGQKKKDERRKRVSDKEILSVARRALWKNDPRRWHYALMDYGASEFSRRPDLLAKSASYHKQSRFEGSPRYWRSQIVTYLLSHRHVRIDEIRTFVPGPVSPLLQSLYKDGLVRKSGNVYYI